MEGERMSCCDEQRQHNYLGALALNNVAIALLERNCYHQGRSVLQDALQTIRREGGGGGDNNKVAQSIRTKEEEEDGGGGGESPDGSRSPTIAMLESKLERASRFLQESAPHPQLRGGASSSSIPAVTIECQVLDMATPRLNVGEATFPDMSSVTLIRMDPNTATNATTSARASTSLDERPNGGRPIEREHRLETLVMLHNFAAAARLHPMSNQELRASAVRVTRLAYALAVRFPYRSVSESLGRRTREDGHDGDPFVALATLQLSVLLAQCHYQLGVDLGDGTEAWQALTHYRAAQSALALEKVQFTDLWAWTSATHAKAA